MILSDNTKPNNKSVKDVIIRKGILTTIYIQILDNLKERIVYRQNVDIFTNNNFMAQWHWDVIYIIVE